MKIEVECKTYDEVLEAVYTPIDIIMLDNMDLTEIRKSVKLIRETNAETGVDYISIGSLTHSVKNHDFSLLFKEL